MAEKVNFGANGVTVEGPLTFIAAIKDKDIEIANEYVRPNADGWDRNRSGGKDADGNVLTANQTLAPNSKYGSAEAMKSVDGYSDINIDYVGYIANTRKFDVTKDIYLSYTLDSKNESANDKDGPKHEQKHFFVGMFNSLTGALINQGQMHETNFGSIAVFGHRVNTEVQANDTMGAGKINVLTGGSSEKNSFTYEEGKPVDLKITIGTDNTKIYQLKEGNWVEIATMDATQKMFPDGMYLVLETTRITWAQRARFAGFDRHQGRCEQRNVHHRYRRGGDGTFVGRTRVLYRDSRGGLSIFGRRRVCRRRQSFRRLRRNQEELLFQYAFRGERSDREVFGSRYLYGGRQRSE